MKSYDEIIDIISVVYILDLNTLKCAIFVLHHISYDSYHFDIIILVQIKMYVGMYVA